LSHNDIDALITEWRLPDGSTLLERIERMVEPAILAGHFGASPTQMVSGLQYHLGGQTDTHQLAELARVGFGDHVLDVCCYLGGPAVQLAESYGCRVTGIDLSQAVILGARRIADLAGMTDQLAYYVADAAKMPFGDGAFDLIWNQGSLRHDATWLREFDRLLRPGGRLALVFDMRPARTAPGPDDHCWTLDEIVAQVQQMGYRIDHAEDLTEREIALGWEALLGRLDERRDVYIAALGNDWFEATRTRFRGEIVAMLAGVWTNGRLIARKERP
jgi:SAM-dependent methyltransferase